jgi:hypothetical protein
MKKPSFLIRRFSLICYGLITLFPFVLFIPGLIQGKVLFWGTPALQFVPWRDYAWENIREGFIPLWNSLSGMGAPFLANYQLAIFYPPGWLLFLFSELGGAPWLAWGFTLFVALHLSWSGIGIGLLLKRLGIGSFGQAVSGIAFSLCGYLVSRSGFFSIIWTASWLPWILLLSDFLTNAASLRHTNRKGFVFLVLALAFQFLAGHAQTSWYSVMLAGGWVITRGWLKGGSGNAFKSLVLLTLAGLAAVILSAVQLFPTIELLAQSQRSTAVDFEQAMTYSFWPWRFLTVLMPDLFGNPGLGDYWGYASYWEDAIYIGIIPLITGFSTLFFLWSSKRKLTQIRNVGLFFWIVIIVGCLLALGKNTPIFPFLYQYMPSFSLFQAPARFMIWAVLALSVLAGIGADSWSPAKGKRLYWTRLGTAGAFSITLGAYLALALLPNVHATFIRAAALTGLWALGAGILALTIPEDAHGTKRPVWCLVVLAWIGMDLLVSSWNLNPVVDMNFYATENKMPAASRGTFTDPRIYISKSDEYDLKFKRFFRFGSYLPEEDWGNLRSALLPNIQILERISSANNFDPLVPERISRWMDYMDSVPEADRITWLKFMHVGGWETVNSNDLGDVKVISIQPDPFIEFKSCVSYVQNENQSFERLISQQQSSENSNRSVIIEKDNPSNEEICPIPTSSIEIVKQNPAKIIFRVTSESDGWVTIKESWYPGWVGRIDGTQVEVLHADYLFQAVQVNSGEHLVELDYRPGWFFAGLWISLGGWLLLLGIIVYSKVAFFHSTPKIG